VIIGVGWRANLQALRHGYGMTLMAKFIGLRSITFEICARNVATLPVNHELAGPRRDLSTFFD